MNELRIEEVVKSAASKGEALENLIREGVSFKDAESAWKKFGSKKVTQGFKAQFFARLREGKLEGEELDAYIKEHGSENDYRQKSINIAIANLANSIHDDIENGVYE